MIKITADSTCDLPKELVAKYAIEIVPLHVTVDDKQYSDGIDISPADVFRYTDAGAQCRTASTNMYEYAELFRRLAPHYTALIHISLGADFSSSCQNAFLAAREYDNVYVIDSQNLSSGSGYLVLKIAEMAAAGMEAETICEKAKALIPDIRVSFVIDKLDYLYKGGRCSGLELAGTKVLRIKPCIEVVSGAMKVGKKYHGSFGYDLKCYVNDQLRDIDTIDDELLFITHANCDKETVALIKTIILQKQRFKNIIVSEAGCTVSVHCGPNTLGIIYKKK